MENKVPAVDLVAVVRCRDCEYCFMDRSIKPHLPPLWRCRKLGRYTRSDGYCNHGLKREDDENEAD